ncbi:GD24867 [Drosophila simulans]|uniref:GD24867 n=1 Tax=Drosophila simulans TaxID=7240 RepID=B4NUP6_DROSI|nr:GD24867 [Drosophila simulans]
MHTTGTHHWLRDKGPGRGQECQRGRGVAELVMSQMRCQTSSVYGNKGTCQPKSPAGPQDDKDAYATKDMEAPSW